MAKVKKRLVITGSSGLLGKELVLQWSSLYHLFPLDRKALDICDREAVIQKILSIKPHIIVHCAAYTNVDRAESSVQESQMCRRVNVFGTQNLVEMAKKLDCLFCFISTDYVFDGDKDIPYVEKDHTNPLNVYGRTKQEAEEYIQKMLERYCIIRIALLSGNKKTCFVSKILNKAEQQKSIYVVDDQIGVPTFTETVADVLPILFCKNIYGLYHLTSYGECSFFEFAKEIISQTKKNTTIIPIKRSQLIGSVPRPFYSVLDNSKIRSLIDGYALPFWKDGLRQVLRTI